MYIFKPSVFAPREDGRTDRCILDSAGIVPQLGTLFGIKGAPPRYKFNIIPGGGGGTKVRGVWERCRR